MAEIKLTPQATVAHLQAFQQSVGDKAEIRAKANKDGTVTLYTHAHSKFSLNRHPQLRQEKQQAAFNAVAGFLRAKYGSGATIDTLVGAMNRPLGAAALDAAIIEAAKAQHTKAEAILGHPELRAAFRTHVEREHSTENLDFYEAIERFNALVDDPAVNAFDLGKELDRIGRTFLTISSNSNVNLSDETRRNYHAAAADLRTRVANQGKGDRVLGTPGGESESSNIRASFRTALEKPKKQIADLMEKDSMKRFVEGKTNGGDIFTPALSRKLQSDYLAERDRTIREGLRQSGLE